MKKLVLIKLGGSLITDKSRPFVSRPRVIRRLVKEIIEAKKKSGKLMVVGHGGGSYPHVPAARYRTGEGMVNGRSAWGMAKVQDAAARLNRRIVKAFLKAGEKAMSFSPSGLMIAKGGRIEQSFLMSLEKALKWGILPVVYGDAAFDLEKGCCILSTELVLNELAGRWGTEMTVERTVYAGITEGVYNDKGETVKEITPDNFLQIEKSLGGSAGIDVTGGMSHKVKEALAGAKTSKEILIINGLKPGNLKKAILGEKVKGTRIKA